MGETMQIVMRGLVGLVGVLALVLTLLLWLRPDGMGVSLGISAVGDVGIATIRADIAGFFGTIALFSLAAAWRNDGRLTIPALVLAGAALFGRVIDLVLSGFDGAKLGSMVVEIVLIVIFMLARRSLSSPAQ